MAEQEQVNKLRADVKKWNTWRRENPSTPIDLRSAQLASANLRNADLRGADLRDAQLSGSNLRVATLAGANLTDAKLIEADLRWIDLKEAILCGAELLWSNLGDAKCADANLKGANLSRTKLNRVDLSRSNLTGAMLRGADLSRAQLADATLVRADLNWANLGYAKATNADMTETDLRSASLQNADLSGAILNRARLWEVQRGGWKIRGIICDLAFWDKRHVSATSFSEGEFERLYSEHARIELYYKGGLSSFELSTLPALIHHLATLHPGARIRLKSVEETGGGATISIAVEGAEQLALEAIEADAQKVHQAQLALRDGEMNRLKIEKDYLENTLLSKLVSAMMLAAPPREATHNYFGSIGTIASGTNSAVNITKDPKVAELLNQLSIRRDALALTSSEDAKLESQLDELRTEISKQDPNRTVLQRSVGAIQKVAAEALAKGAGKLSEAAIDNWQTWAHELSEHLHHLL